MMGNPASNKTVFDRKQCREQSLALLPPRQPKQPVEPNLAKRLESALIEYSVDAMLGPMSVGPRVVRIPIKLGRGVRLRAIRSVLPDIAMRLGVHGVRLSVGAQLHLEVPRATADVIGLEDVFTEATYKDLETMELPWAVGLATDGQPILRDLAQAPHILIAGATGSGKSAALTSLVMSLMLTTTPDECEIVLIDPKRVDLAPLSEVPHVRRHPSVTPEEALEDLTSLTSEMRHRYTLFEALGVSNLAEYNAAVTQLNGTPLHRIVIIIDELADLIAFDREAFEHKLIVLAQVARAAGMHLVCATQRPSAQVLSTQFRSQMPTRLVFAVSSATDSRVALDESGAEKLLGHGDGLCKWAGQTPIRIQSPFVWQDWRSHLTWEVYHSVYAEMEWSPTTPSMWSYSE